jgi:hypothetical protein
MDLYIFIIGKTKERRGEGRVGKKDNSCLPKHREDKMSKKIVAACQLNTHEFSSSSSSNGFSIVIGSCSCSCSRSVCGLTNLTHMSSVVVEQ